MINLCRNATMRHKMGAIGQQRVEQYYKQEYMIENYQKAYQKAIQIWQASGSN